MQMSFGTLELSKRLKRDSVLMKIDALRFLQNYLLLLQILRNPAQC